jgi:hypothetical protein
MQRPTSDHFDGRRFFNPTGPTPQPFSAVPRMLMERRTPWPARVDAPARPPAPRDDAEAVVTFVGHSTFLIQTAAGNLLTDPMYSKRAGPLWFGPLRVRPPAVRFDDLPEIGVVLLSHNHYEHYDHCDLRTLGMLAARFVPIVVTPVGNRALVESAGIRRIEELDWWQPGFATVTSLVPTIASPTHGCDGWRSTMRAVARTGRIFSAATG